jgi:N-acetylmuramoyl-L-alanine amidase
MRHAQRPTRAALAALVVALLLTSILPALPALARGPIKVTGRDVHTSVDHQRVVPLPITASHVALSWHGAREAVVSVAFGMQPNALGEEVAVEAVDEDEAPDDVDIHGPAASNDAGAAFSDVLWTGGARFVRITSDRPLGKVTVTAIDAQADKGIQPFTTAAAMAAVDQPNILPRKSWGADEDLRFDGGNHETWPAEFSPMQKAIVHHTAGRNNDPNPAATIRAIYWNKTISRGFGDIGYNFLIDEAGHIYEGRHSRDYAAGEPITGEDLAGNVVRGGHAKNFNDGTVGIVLLGNFQHRQPTLAARTALDRLLAWKLERHGLSPFGVSVYHNPVLGNTKTLSNISGHRNVNSTACPGDTFYPTFPQLRQRVANRINGTTGPGKDNEPPEVDSFASMNSSPTGSETLRFGLLFEEPVTGLDPSDFDISGSSHGWDVSDVSGGPEGYAIEVSASNPDDGTVHIELAAEAVSDLAGLTGPPDPVSAQASFGEDSEAPTVVLYHAPHRTYVRDARLNYFNVTATFSEPVVGFTSDDVQLGGTSQAKRPWDVPAMFGSGANYGFAVMNNTWQSGTLTIKIPAGAVTDLAGNPVEASNVTTIYLDVGKPTVTPPRTTLRSDTTLSGATLRAQVTWTGADFGPAGIASYDVARSIDGNPFHLIASGLKGPSLWWGVTPGHTYRFEVRAHDKAGNVGGWKAGTTVRPILVQQTSTLVRFFGPSAGASKTSFSAGSERHLAAGGSYAIFETQARSLSFVTTTGPDRGEVDIYIDGVYQTRIDLGDAITTYRAVVFSKSWATVGTHRIKVVAVGTAGRPRVDVDAFGVLR